jgi:hypothetical protein
MYSCRRKVKKGRKFAYRPALNSDLVLWYGDMHFCQRSVVGSLYGVGNLLLAVSRDTLVRQVEVGRFLSFFR